jgi:hypothetical protein
VEVTPTELVRKYRALRDRKQQIEARHEEELEPIKAAMKGLEGMVLLFLQKAGVNSIASDDGTAYVSERNTYRVADPAALKAYCQQTGDLSLLTSAVSKEAVAEYIEAHGALPPGVEVRSEQTVGFRAPTKSKKK